MARKSNLELCGGMVANDDKCYDQHMGVAARNVKIFDADL